MGELATWSAVKTKVGLGKDGTEIPTKAELLALTPTGTGENYVELELSNASSYGNTEGVKLEDIHKVTYKYTFSLYTNLISFTAKAGNSTTGVSSFVNVSTKERYLDNVATGIIYQVDYTTTNNPSWVSYHPVVGWVATENLELSVRSKTDGVITQNESGKTLTVGWTQAAATQSWSYTFSANPTSLSFGPRTSTQVCSINTSKQEIRNDHNYGNPIQVPVTNTISGAGFSVKDPLDGVFDFSITASDNKSTSVRVGSFVVTQTETGKKITLNLNQSAGYKSYGPIYVSDGSVNDIPAGGGTVSSFNTLPNYSQQWGWNGSYLDGGTISSGASFSTSASVSAPSLGTAATPRTKRGTLTCTINLNGSSNSKTLDVYQAENKMISTTDGVPVISIFASVYTIANTGGYSAISSSVTIPTTNTWSSGATSTGTAKTATPNLSISGAGFDFDPINYLVAVLENTAEVPRRCVVTASYTGAIDKSVTIEQGAAVVEYRYTFKIL